MDQSQPKGITSASAPPRPAPPYAPPAHQYAPTAPQYAPPAPMISYAPQVQHVVSSQPPQQVHLAQHALPQPFYLAQQGLNTFAPVGSNPLPVGTTTITLVGGSGGGDRLLPGMCSVCRMGHIKNRPTCCTYFFCLLLFPVGILPGLLAFYFCCRKPTCGTCHFKC